MFAVTADHPLTARLVIRRVWEALRAMFWRIVLPAAVIFGLAGVLTALFELLVEAMTHDLSPFWRAVVVVLVFVDQGAITLAMVFYAGFLDLYVGGPLYHGSRVSLAQVVRSLPYGRLLVADAIVVVAAGVGWALFVVPGLLVITFSGLVGPVINIEGHGLRDAFVRSVSLVRRRFWLVLLLVTVPEIGEVALIRALESVFHPTHLVVAFTAHAVFGVLVGGAVGVGDVVLAHELVGRYPHGEQAPAAGPAAAPLADAASGR